MAKSAWMYPQLTSLLFSSSVNRFSLVLICPSASGHFSAMANGLSISYLVGFVLIIHSAPFFRPLVRSFINSLILSALVCSTAALMGRVALFLQNFHLGMVSTDSGLLPFDTKRSFISLMGWSPRLS